MKTQLAHDNGLVKPLLKTNTSNNTRCIKYKTGLKMGLYKQVCSTNGIHSTSYIQQTNEKQNLLQLHLTLHTHTAEPITFTFSLVSSTAVVVPLEATTTFDTLLKSEIYVTACTSPGIHVNMLSYA